MNKQPEVTAATRTRITDAFWAIYEKKRIEQIRIREVADLAGVHRGTFYEYFTDIYDLLAKEEESLINDVLVNAGKIQSMSMEDMLSRIVDIYMSAGKRLCLLIGSGGDPDFIYKFKDALYPEFRKLRALPNSGAISVVFEFGINGIIMAFNAWYTSESRIPVEDFMETLRCVIENGIPKTLENMAS